MKKEFLNSCHPQDTAGGIDLGVQSFCEEDLLANHHNCTLRLGFSLEKHLGAADCHLPQRPWRVGVMFTLTLCQLQNTSVSCWGALHVSGALVFMSGDSGNKESLYSWVPGDCSNQRDGS